MNIVIKAVDERSWRPVLTSQTHSTTKDDEGKVIIKLEILLSSRDDRLANYNSKALHDILNIVDANQIKLIATRESAKKAWDIFQTTHEGTNNIKHSRL